MERNQSVGIDPGQAPGSEQAPAPGLPTEWAVALIVLGALLMLMLLRRGFGTALIRLGGGST